MCTCPPPLTPCHPHHQAQTKPNPPHAQPHPAKKQEGFTWQVVKAVGSGMQLLIEGLQELPTLLREPRPRPAAAFVVLWIIGA